MQIDLTGRTALITGGSKGLGLASALNLVESGANVAILARDPATLEQAAKDLRARARGGRVVALACDVSSQEQIEKSWAAVAKEFDAVDILVNNAGGYAAGRFDKLTDATWEADLQVKLFAMIRLTRLAWPGMVARRHGRVISVLNTLAKAPPAGSAPTSVTRAAQVALTKVLAQEGAPHNVLVNALLVGTIKTGGIEQLHRNSGSTKTLDEFATDFAVNARIPMGRVGEADEFGKLMCFLASDASSYVTGTAINVDGGSCPVV
jgi:3-oxoacyl-[acyl-carrier protein] reductase